VRVTDRTLAQPPDEAKAPSVSSPASYAGGAGAIEYTTRHVLKHMGPVRGTRTLLRVNQTNGFDCPGCAWPEPQDHRGAIEFCENGAKAIASEATTKHVTPAFFARYSVAALLEQSDYWLNEQGRLTHPMLLREGGTHYESVSWDEAFALVGRQLSGLASPDEAAFYTSGRTSNEAAFLYQLLARQLGTNNLPDCSNMCHESSGAAMMETLGVGKGTVTLEDFALADAIFIIGQNPGTNHPRMLTALEDARRRGATIVVVNPLREAGNQRFAHPQDPADIVGGGTQLSSLLLQVRINGDVAAFKGIMKAMLAREEAAPGSVVDRAFIAENTTGYDELVASLAAVGWDEIVRESGVSRELLEQAGHVAADAKNTIVCWSMGLTQHKNGVGNIREAVNLLLLRGNFGRPGAGACPVRGHSNVQGDRTMGVWEKMPDDFLDRLGEEFGFAPPRKHGADTVEAIGQMLEGHIKVFVGMGGNFLSATPDTERTAEALRGCRLTVQVSTKLNRGHLVTGKQALILPCLGRTERDLSADGRRSQFVTVENSMSVVSASEGKLAPAAATLKSEVAIVCGIAGATFGTDGTRSRADWRAMADDYDLVRDHVSRVVEGFDDFNARVREPGGFHLASPTRKLEFDTRDGKAHFTVNPIPHHALGPGQMLMMTMRSHDQYNTAVYGMDDRYRGVRGGRRVVFLNVEDLAERGLVEGDLVDLVSQFTDGERTAEHFRVVPYDIPRACAATYFPEANVLVPLGSVADVSNTPTSKSVVIRLQRSVNERAG
jgi:molybdopterin-dependent oxidoreductase alpha subunit